MLQDLLLNSVSNAPPAIGDKLFIAAGTYNFIVPENVFSISTVCVGSGGGNVTSVGTYCKATYRKEIGDGGGTGGGGGGTNGGGGGAAGYTGNGGAGAPNDGKNSGGRTGGGVGLYGQGANGAGGSISNHPSGSPGTGGGGGGGAGDSTYGYSGTPQNNWGNGWPGSGGNGTQFGGGGGGYNNNAMTGGGLAFTNNIPVTPGQVIQVIIGNGINGSSDGGARIVWPGTTRRFPSTNVAKT